MDAGYREVIAPKELARALKESGFKHKFDKLIYSKRKEYARQVEDAKALDTKERRIEKIIEELNK